MTLTELKTILGIYNTDQDSQLQILLDAGIEYARDFCEKTFEDDSGNLVLPDVVKVGVSKFVETALQTANVKSESISDLSTSFFSDDLLRVPRFYFQLYRNVTYV